MLSSEKGRGAALWRRLSLVRKSQAQADASTRVDTTTTTTTKTPSRGAIISANAVGVFYRGIFLRADPVYTAEWYTAPTFNAIHAGSDATTLLRTRAHPSKVVHGDVREDARQLEDTIHRLAARLTPGSLVNEATTHGGRDTVRPPAGFTPFSPETLSARNTEEEPQREPHRQQRSSAVDPPPVGWQWVTRRAAREKSTDREGTVTEPSQPKVASRNRRGSSVWASTRSAAAPAAHEDSLEDSPSTACWTLTSCGDLNHSSPSTTCEDSMTPREDSPSTLWNTVYSY